MFVFNFFVRETHKSPSVFFFLSAHPCPEERRIVYARVRNWVGGGEKEEEEEEQSALIARKKHT